MTTEVAPEILVPKAQAQSLFTMVLREVPLDPCLANLTFSALGIDLPQDREDDPNYSMECLMSGVITGSSTKLYCDPNEGLLTNGRAELEFPRHLYLRNPAAAGAFLLGGKIHQIDLKVRGIEDNRQNYQRFLDEYLKRFEQANYQIRSGMLWLSKRKAPEYSLADIEMVAGLKFDHLKLRGEAVMGSVQLKVEDRSGYRLALDKIEELDQWFSNLQHASLMEITETP